MAKHMTAEQFKSFFDDLSTIATDPTRGATSPMDVLKKHGLEVELSPKLEAQLKPALVATAQTRVRVQGNACGVCPVCGVCVACGEINYGTPGACAASVWNI